MKVQLLYSKYLSDPTGASAVMRFLKQGKDIFKENDVDIEFFTRDNILPSKKMYKKAQDKNIELSVKDKFMIFLRKQSKTNPIAALLHKYIRSGRAAKILIEKYKKDNPNPDIVFIHELDTCYEYLKSRRVEDKAKVVLVIHENGITHHMTFIEYPSLKKNIFYKGLLRKANYVFNNVDRLGYVSETSMNTFINNNPDYPLDKLFFNFNGIPIIDIPSKLVGNENVVNICCIGTVNERKGQRNIVEALSLISEDKKEKIHINIVGDGEIKEELEFFCKEKRLEKYISFLGHRSDIPQILSQNDIFILPSKNEGLPISILEAMRQGLAVVSSNVGGIPEMIENGKSGILIEPNTEALVQLFNNISRFNWEDMGKESKKLFDQKFSLKRMIEKYSEIFHDVIND